MGGAWWRFVSGAGRRAGGGRRGEREREREREMERKRSTTALLLFQVSELLEGEGIIKMSCS